MSREYEFPESFQAKLLAAYIREPEQVYSIVLPEYFSSPIHSEIARLTKQLFDKYNWRETKLSLETLRTVVKGYLGRKREEIWPMYKSVLKTVFADELGDLPILREQALEFARERKFRKAMVMAEGDINDRNYEGAIKRFNDLIKLGTAKASNSGMVLPSCYLHQFLAQEENDDAAKDYLVYPVVPKQGAVLVYGLPKELKSWFVSEVAVAVASGRKAFGYFTTPSAAKTFYIQVEDRAALTRERLGMMTRDGSLRRLSTLTNLRIVPRCPLNLSDPLWVAALEEEIQKFKPALVVLDVFRRLFRGNVNESSETAAFLRVLDNLRDTYGCAIVLAHHAKKTEGAAAQAMALGSVNLTAWADVLVYTKGKRQDGTASVADLEIVTKSSLSEEDGLEIVVDAESEPMVRVQAKGGNDAARLQELIAERPGILQKELQEKSKLSDKTLRRILKDGVEKRLWKEKRAEGEGNRLGYFPFAKP